MFGHLERAVRRSGMQEGTRLELPPIKIDEIKLHAQRANSGEKKSQTHMPPYQSQPMLYWLSKRRGSLKEVNLFLKPQNLVVQRENSLTQRSDSREKFVVMWSALKRGAHHA